MPRGWKTCRSFRVESPITSSIDLRGNRGSPGVVQRREPEGVVGVCITKNQTVLVGEKMSNGCLTWATAGGRNVKVDNLDVAVLKKDFYGLLLEKAGARSWKGTV